MLEQVVRLTVSLKVNDGQLDEFKSVVHAMTEGSKAEPGTLGYEWFSDKDSSHFRLVETYVDAGAVEAHFLGPVVQQWVPKLVALVTINAVEFYGDPGPKVVEMASGLGSVFFQYWQGINR
jgi:quinol monooxygenase YgiN